MRDAWKQSDKQPAAWQGSSRLFTRGGNGLQPIGQERPSHTVTLSAVPQLGATA